MRQMNLIVVCGVLAIFHRSQAQSSSKRTVYRYVNPRLMKYYLKVKAGLISSACPSDKEMLRENRFRCMEICEDAGYKNLKEDLTRCYQYWVDRQVPRDKREPVVITCRCVTSYDDRLQQVWAPFQKVKVPSSYPYLETDEKKTTPKPRPKPKPKSKEKSKQVEDSEEYDSYEYEEYDEEDYDYSDEDYEYSDEK